MLRRGFMAGSVAGLTALVAACSKKPEKPAAISAPPAPPPPPPPPPETVDVSLMTEKGEIVIRLETKKAPITAANFLHYLDTRKFDGGTFWRATGDNRSGFIQATAEGLTYPPISHESTKVTGLSHTNGAISMSRYAVGTAQNEFIICVGDNTSLDAGHNPKGDNAGYAVFGYVVKGMDVVKEILHGKIDPKTPPAGGWAGQMLLHPVVITKGSRVTAAAAVASST